MTRLSMRPKRPAPERAFNFAFWTLTSLFIAFFVWQLAIGGIRILFEAPWLVFFTTVFVAFAVLRRHFRRKLVRGFLRPHAGFVCPRCLYPLRKLPDVGVCPECGLTYNRAEVVAMWERAYELPGLFPRAAPAPVSPPTSAILRPTVPWARWSLHGAFSDIESCARRRGFNRNRIPSLVMELDSFNESLPRPLPPEMLGFLGWYDSALWSEFVRNSNSHESSPNDWFGAPSLPIVIRALAHLRIGTAAELSHASPAIAAFLSSASEDRRLGWSQTQFIEFADSSEGPPVIYCTDPPDLPRGCIITFLPGVVERIWLADSLGQWLTRLAACEGVEFAFHPEQSARLSEPTRTLYVHEFSQRNPDARLFETPPVAAANK